MLKLSGISNKKGSSSLFYLVPLVMVPGPCFFAPRPLSPRLLSLVVVVVEGR